MKKFLSALTLASVLAFGVTGALAVVPHAHGDDFGHSKHQTCPVHQAAGHTFQAAITTAFFTLTLLLSGYVFQAPAAILFTRPTRFASLRAPPASV